MILGGANTGSPPGENPFSLLTVLMMGGMLGLFVLE